MTPGIHSSQAMSQSERSAARFRQRLLKLAQRGYLWRGSEEYAEHIEGARELARQCNSELFWQPALLQKCLPELQALISRTTAGHEACWALRVEELVPLIRAGHVRNVLSACEQSVFLRPDRILTVPIWSPVDVRNWVLDMKGH